MYQDYLEQPVIRLGVFFRSKQDLSHIYVYAAIAIPPYQPFIIARYSILEYYTIFLLMSNNLCSMACGEFSKLLANEGFFLWFG